CSAAKAAQFALPRDLDSACRVMGLPFQKDKAGHAIMMKLSRPRKHSKGQLADLKMLGLDPALNPIWNEDPQDLLRLWAYCQQDVRAERGLSKALRPMRSREIEFWRMDQRMNMRGIACDVEGVKIALDMAEQEAKDLNAEMSELTDGAVPKGSSRAKL